MTEQHDGPLAQQLQRLILAIEASGRAVLPASNQELLQSIVEAAARIFGAAASSIALVDEQAQELVFKVSYGAGSDEVVGMRIPIDTGIAGYVAMTGQPIAISDVQRDARFARSFASSTGYVPRSILATPLVYRERVLGVMEVLDKISAPSFGLQDMELLGMFARQAAISIDHSQQTESLNQVLVQGLRRLAVSGAAATAGASDGAAPDELLSALERSTTAASDVRTNDLLALADRFQAVSELGEAERKVCLEILETFGRYAQARRTLPE